MFLSEQDYLERLQDFFPKRSINLAASKTFLDFSIWKNVNGSVPWVGALGPPINTPGPKDDSPGHSLFLLRRVGVGRGASVHSSQTIRLFYLFFNLFCLFVNLFPNVHYDL